MPVEDTGSDLTAATMAQIVFEETKDEGPEKPLPVPALRKIIVSGLPVG
jgi:polyhydroxyalkanoate synthesis regulator protein